tara:strand:- start:5698 stop:7395 length:1698 start_codon:yes stop_codon:yes gene_type:complete
MKSVKGLEDIANAVEPDMGATDPKTEGASAIALPAYNFDTARASSLAEVDDVPDRRVMETSPRTDAQIVESISTGDPAGLEHLYFGATELGHPVMGFRDSNGNTQVMKVTSSQWMAAKEARRLNRERVLEEQDRQENLNKEKTELRPTFEDGLDSVDDEAYRALLQQMFEDDPQRAVRELVADRRGSSMDEEKNQAKRDGLKNEQAWETSKRVQNQNINESNQARASLDKARQQAISSTGDSSAAIAQIRSQQREISLRETAMAYAPSPNNATASPSEAMNPRQFKDALRAWLPMVERMIPHPSNPNIDAAMEDLFGALNGIARDIGWQKGITERDLGAVQQAVSDYLGVHGEAVEIQNLTRENEKLQKEIEDMRPLQNTPDLSPEYFEQAQQQVTTTQEEITQRKTSLGDVRGKDTNRDGVVSAEEEASFERDKSTLESSRAAVKGAKKAKLVSENEGKIEDAKKAMLRIESDLEKSSITSTTESSLERDWVKNAMLRMQLDSDFTVEIKEKVQNLIKRYDEDDDKTLNDEEFETATRQSFKGDVLLLKLAREATKQEAAKQGK